MSDQRTANQLKKLNLEPLRTLATSEGVEVSEDDTKDQIVAKLDAAGKVAPAGGDESQPRTEGDAESKRVTPTGPDDDKLAEAGVKREFRRSPFADEPHFFVTIHSTDDEDGTRPVDVTVNGYNFRIPRDQEVYLPRAALEALEHAVETRLDEIGRDQVTGAPIFRERRSRRFAFNHRAA